MEKKYNNGVKEKEKKGRHAYLNDFKLNENNEYEYRGAIYEPQFSDEEKKRIHIKGGILHLLLSACIILAGWIPYQGLAGSFYVVIPYAFEVIFIAWQYPHFFRCFFKDSLREYEYRKSAARIRPFYFVIVFNAALSMIAALLYGTFNGFEPVSISLAYSLLQLTCFALAFYLTFVFNGLVYQQKEQ